MGPAHAVVRDPSTGVEFVRIGGGTADLGLRAGEWSEVLALAGPEAEGAEVPGAPSPSHRVTLGEFLVSRGPLPRDLVAPLVADYDSFTGDDIAVSGKDAAKVAETLGYRLLTHDEWEFVARGGGRGSWTVDAGALVQKAFRRKPKGKLVLHNPFGIDGLGWGSWVAPEKGKVPTQVRAGGMRTFPWQEPLEVVLVHAAFRWNENEKEGKWPLLVAWDGQPRTPSKSPPRGSEWKGRVHVPTQLTFVDIPGGTFEMGLGAEERRRLEALVPPELAKAFAKVADASPLRRVTVAPFRCASSPILPDVSKKLGGSTDSAFGAASNPLATVVKWAKQFGFRLLTEAEWELVARDGGTRGWGADLEILLRRAYRGAAPPKAHRNAFGLKYLAAPAFVDTGKGAPGLARSIAQSDFPYDPLEILPKAIVDASVRSRDWRAALFALDETTKAKPSLRV
jgi:formylglycine-generating enzyme required for sulfatase activity